MRDRVNPAIDGNTPRHQANLIFQATPQVSTDRFAVGAVLNGATKSFAQDTNLLTLLGYVTANAFAQVRIVDRLLVSLNATNRFDVVALTAHRSRSHQCNRHRPVAPSDWTGHIDHAPV